MKDQRMVNLLQARVRCERLRIERAMNPLTIAWNGNRNCIDKVTAARQGDKVDSARSGVVVDHENALSGREADLERHFSTEIVLHFIEHTTAGTSEGDDRVPGLVGQSQGCSSIGKLELQSTENEHICRLSKISLERTFRHVVLIVRTSSNSQRVKFTDRLRVIERSDGHKGRAVSILRVIASQN